MDKFKEFSVKQEEFPLNPEANKPLASNNSNDVFINEDDIGYDMPFISNPQNNILDDLFADNIVEPMQEEILPKETIETYMRSVVSENGIG